MEHLTETARTNRDYVIRLRVTEKERDEFGKRAKEHGHKTISDFIRTLITDERELNLHP